ncbi:hypothetical protein [Pseudobacillus wudalianchiensis]|uniref:Bacterial Ig-like domain-containing protein n=1 Tax=Pseudobacillus wudalianchiensis TaxID=1743143 RepID=A0A1B9AU48_9BACI|nr:hypothetical protein [Bacillus wudalianchiensis]OCA87281.1 hypothetical protein A8F95_08515 [Bacillus wudalianchiensis]
MSFFTVELDTTAPEISIIAPSYAGRDNWNKVVVQGNEVLGSKQEFYFIDSLGDRHDVTFLHEKDHYVGEVRFNDFPNGITTFYAVAEDEVGNVAPKAELSINIVGNPLKGVVDFSIYGRSPDYELTKRKQNMLVFSRGTEMNSAARAKVINPQTRTGVISIE